MVENAGKQATGKSQSRGLETLPVPRNSGPPVCWYPEKDLVPGVEILNGIQPTREEGEILHPVFFGEKCWCSLHNRNFPLR